ncbi:MAG TPA: aspartate aminotransferase family protein [Symbiobacteriaceae bacterium]|nr:aspartate aminotransferase family protein [Symbiobacteriaceae bacterium]
MNLRELDKQHLIHAEVHFREFYRKGPVIITRAEGSTVYDSDGNAYLDAQGGLALVNIGYGRREIAAVAARQMEELMYYHTYFNFSNDAAVLLAARLAGLAPEGLGKVFFTLGGAEAVESAAKLARLYQRARGRVAGDKIICLDLAYHGNTMGALSATGLAKHKELFGPLVPGFIHIAAPDRFEGPWGYDDPEAGAKYAALLEERIRREGPETVAAFLAEPVLGVGGVIIPPDDYWRHVRAICDKYGILWIADEVMTGFGRTGTTWAVEQYGATPDVICTAKGLTSGYLPLGAIIIRDSVIDTIAEADLPFTHGFTYAGHPVACQVAMAAIDIFEREDLAGHAARMGALFMERLAARENPHIGDMRGKGLMIGVELVRQAGGKERIAGLGFAVEAAAFAEGVITGVAPYREALLLTPPLVLTEAEVDRLVAVFDRVIRAEANRLVGGDRTPSSRTFKTEMSK